MKQIIITPARYPNGFYINTKFVLKDNWNLEITKNRFTPEEQLAFETRILKIVSDPLTSLEDQQDINNIEVQYETVNPK